MRSPYALVPLAALAPVAAPQNLPVEGELTAPAPAAGALLGASAALSDDVAVVGAPQAATSNFVPGSAFVYRRSGPSWSVEQVLSSGVAYADRFGASVAVEGGTAIVGAPWYDAGPFDAAGAVFVYEEGPGGWSAGAPLFAASPSTGASFGDAVALDGDTLVVGSWRESGAPGSFFGAAYVFVRAGSAWTQQARLTADTPADGQNLGASVAVCGDTILVGADGEHIGGEPLAGAAYVFTRSGTAWSQQARLTRKKPASLDRFGCSVALRGDTALIGAFGEDTAEGVDAGAAYVFTRSGSAWTHRTKLKAVNGKAGDQLGTAVALVGDTALIGANGDDVGGVLDAGSASVFRGSGADWTPLFKLRAPPVPMGHLGEAVALDGAAFLVGMPGQDTAGPETGAAFVFREAAVPYCTAGTSASGCRASLTAGGSPSASATGGFPLIAWGVEGGKDGLFFFGTSGRQASPWGNGSSYQCVAPPVSRTGLLTGAGTPGACDGLFTRDLNALWCPSCPQPQKNPGAGAVVQSQLWYRDPQSTSNQTTSLSNAIEFTVGP